MYKAGLPLVPFNFHNRHRDPNSGHPDRPRPDQGVHWGEREHKYVLFADYLLLFLTSPLTLTPKVFVLLQDFGKESRLEVNLAKSMALNVSVPADLVDRLRDCFPFIWNPTHIPYLAVQLTADIDSLCKYNYPSLFCELEADLQQWSLHNISWLGRIHTVKIALLLRILYFFRSLPIPIPRSVLARF